MPSVDRILDDGRIRRLAESYPHDLLLSLVRRQLEVERQAITTGRQRVSSPEEIVEAVVSRLRVLEKPSLRPVVNASGVILHTNLGRASLSAESVTAMNTVAGSYSNLEFDLESGTRRSRHIHIEELLCQLTGAEAALVVNNNAAAVLLVLTALAKRKEVIVSRGQAVEIGGGFRIPDVMRQSGARLVEVGTTNCTYARDYEQAINPRTAALLRVHTSNFKVVGFAAEVTIEEMAALGDRYGLAVFDDLGSGCFLDTAQFGLAPEPVVTRSVALGVGITCFSGDKLVGGPQAGIIVGKKELVAKLKRHPLARAVRIDKIRLAGLTATLLHYLKGEATAKIPVWRMIAAPLDEVARRADKWADVLGELAEVVDGETMVGGGSLPGGSLPTRLVAIRNRPGRTAVQSLSRKLRSLEIPVIGRIGDDRLLLDPRSVLPEEDEIVCRALRAIAPGRK